MLVRTIQLAAVAGVLCVAAGYANLAAAQQAKPKPAPSAAPARPASASDDAARKAEILASPQWRRMMFEFKEWLSAQQIYDPKQVDQIKAGFNRRVAGMTAQELEYLLADMQAKFQIINSPQAQDARAWLASYLSVMSDKKKAEVLKDIPNVATMTAAQLQQEIQKIERKRTTIDREQASFRSNQEELASAQLRRDQASWQTYINERDRGPTTTYSPYRSPSDVNAHLNRGQVGSGMSYYVSPWGGVGIVF